MWRFTNILFGAALLAACTDDDVPELDEISGPAVDYSASLSPAAPYTVRGSSSIVVASGGQSFSAAVGITGAVPGSQHPWHVHFGACGDGGGIVGTAEYPLLAVDGAGNATATASVTFALVPSVRYSVNVHLAPNDLATIIACGDYVFEGTTGGGGGDNDGDGGGRY